MKILIVNERIAKRTGTEIVARDMSTGLAARGHTVAILTAERGSLADEIEASGVTVHTDPATVSFTPDIIHFNDLALAERTTRAFADTPAMLQWHRFVERDFSIDGTRITSVVGVSRRIVEKISNYTGVETDGVFNNYVDLTRFEPRRDPLPEKPRKWLLVGQQKRGYPLLATLAVVALSKGILLHTTGPRYFSRVDNLPQNCAGYDLVFASGRCALEAACAGAGVVVTDFNGVGGFLDEENVARFYDGNFSFRSFKAPVSLTALNQAIADYRPDGAAAASRWLRENADLQVGLGRLTDLYERARRRAEPPRVPAH